MGARCEAGTGRRSGRGGARGAPRAYLQEAADCTGHEAAIGAELRGRHRLLEGEMVQQRTALPVDQQAAAVLVDGEQQPAIGADAGCAHLHPTSAPVAGSARRNGCLDTSDHWRLYSRLEVTRKPSQCTLKVHEWRMMSEPPHLLGVLKWQCHAGRLGQVDLRRHSQVLVALH